MFLPLMAGLLEENGEHVFTQFQLKKTLEAIKLNLYFISLVSGKLAIKQTLPIQP